MERMEAHLESRQYRPAQVLLVSQPQTLGHLDAALDGRMHADREAEGY